MKKFETQFNIILSSSVLLSCFHIHTVNDILNYGTILSPELGSLTLGESTEEVYHLNMAQGSQEKLDVYDFFTKFNIIL